MLILVRYLWFSAITVFPFMIVRKQDYSITLLNHEYIHLKQQTEMFIVFAYVWYFIEWLIKVIYYMNFRKAYLAVSFEREAVAGEPIIGYAGNRKPYAWFKFIYIPDSKIRTKQWQKLKK